MEIQEFFDRARRTYTRGRSERRGARLEVAVKNISCKPAHRGRPLWTSLALISALSLGIPTRVWAQVQPGPLDISGEINGAPFRIVVPATWNGTLLVFQRGYTDKADHPGEIDNRNPTISPSAAVTNSLLARGYAVTGSSRKSNGYSVEEGLDDVVALASYFKENVANPMTSILWGVSLGGLITLETAERNAGAFDGYLALSSPAAGAPRLFDYFLVLRLAYDVTFGMPSSWGTPGDIRDSVDFEGEVRPILVAQASDPANFGRFEFIRLVAGIPGSGIDPPPGLYPGALIGLPFFLATEGVAELERRAGGPTAQNVSHTYTLTAAEKVYLASLGVDADPLLEAMNARRNLVASPEQRNYLKHFADFSGLIKRPVVTVHNRVDVALPATGETEYGSTVGEVGRDDLVQLYTTGIGHGGGSPTTNEQQVLAIEAVETWAKTGVPPAASDFPAALGFIPDFVPPPWPQPDIESAALNLSCGACAMRAVLPNQPGPGPMLELLGTQPFRGEASLRYGLREPAWVKLEVFGVDGRRVRTLVNRYEATGSHTAQFALNDGSRAPLGPGVYFVRLAIGSQVQSLRIVGLN